VIDAYPLQWPVGWKKTSAYMRGSSKFGSKSFAIARDLLMEELRRFRAKDIILSTNIPLRKDGLPYSGYRQPEDVGVAVYFKLSGLYKDGRLQPDKSMVFACDKWRKIEENIYAIYKTIEALRGVQRWGSSDLMERSFTGFAALPPAPMKRDWWVVLGVPRSASVSQITREYRALMMQHHPDRGGDPAKAAEINSAYSEGIKDVD
jgi:hypothetical protein